MAKFSVFAQFFSENIKPNARQYLANSESHSHYDLKSNCMYHATNNRTRITSNKSWLMTLYLLKITAFVKKDKSSLNSVKQISEKTCRLAKFVKLVNL